MYELLLMWNLIVFALYGIDKHRAKSKTLRIPEAVLIIFSLMFGGVGAIFGMVVFNHKTSKLKFRLLVPFAVIINVLMLGIDYPSVVARLF